MRACHLEVPQCAPVILREVLPCAFACVRMRCHSARAVFLREVPQCAPVFLMEVPQC